jgi:serine/threonine protein kinase/Tol biopolymer transport system component
MAILSGKRLGPYEILSAIGAGGMGEVYRARDTRLERTVAVKILPDHLSDRAELRERFEREARTIASLNHPHICTLYDLGHQDGTDFLVMEYLEGETLAQRLQKGRLPLEQVLQYAIEIADALDKAHRTGITHRDLKPGNIMLTKSGTKLLDFGLAKLKASPIASPLSQLPTANDSITAQGTILGTLQYMAPEQLEGKEADARTDIFAFGVVVYEMATGKKAFEGKSQASLIAAILEREPAPIASLQPMTPPALDHLVKTCLAKDPNERWQTAADVTKQLKWIADGGSHVALPKAVVSRRKTLDRLGWIAAAVFLAVAAMLAAIHFREAPKDLRPIYFSIFPPEKRTLSPGSYVAVSPDGNQLAFVAIADGKQSIWIRPLGALAARPLPGTEGGTSPFWSPDSQYVGFFSGERLYKAAISGGPPQPLCDVSGFEAYRAGTWNLQGSILFGSNGKPLYRVSAAGGEATPVTRLDQSRQETGHYFPSFLPDGRHFLFLAHSSKMIDNGIYVGSLDSNDTKLLLQANSEAQYAPPGYLLFVREGTLTAQIFDASRREISGEPFPLADHVQFDPYGGLLAPFSASENGVLVYRNENENTQLAFVDREGRQLQSVGPPGEYRNPALSPDGKRVVIDRYDIQTGGRDLWLYELSRGTASKFTFNRSDNSDAVWSPDGQEIVFYSNRGGSPGIYRKLSSGAGQEELLVQASYIRWPKAWSSDGRILFQGLHPNTAFGLWVLALVGDRQPIPFVQTEFDVREGRFSPTGRWIAYDSNETGRREVYVQPFPASGGKWQVSINGGSQPKWRLDGTELFYLAADGKLMDVPVTANANFKQGIPKALFQTMFIGDRGGGFEHYQVTADGQSFLINTPSAEGTDAPITVVLNWTAGLKK